MERVPPSELHNHWAWAARPEFMDPGDRVKLAYERARAVVESYNLTAEEIDKCVPRFWDMQCHGLNSRDVGSSNVLFLHVNLFLGTLIPLLKRRPDLAPIIDGALKTEFFGGFLLTEVGHGLDVTNIETTATQVDDGFVLHTPTPGAAKIMPPTGFTHGFTKLALVFARLVVDGESRGIHPFLVTLCTGRGMCTGISSSTLPPRAGTSPLDYAITTFDNVRLPPGSFLGHSLAKPKDPKALLLRTYMWRVTVGIMSISGATAQGLKYIATIGYDYSRRRHVQGDAPRPVPILSFRTQQLPVLYATAVAHVMDAWRPRAIEYFMTEGLEPVVKRAFVVMFKATVLRTLTTVSPLVSERLGAQGTFGHNILNQLELDIRGFSIAEGDIMVTCIGLFSELLLGRYALPPLADPDTLLARHAAGVFARCQALLARTGADGHRGDTYGTRVLPQCELGVTALGHAHAHSAAAAAGVPAPLLALFECFCMRQDLLWYAEHAGLTDEAFRAKEDAAVRAALPHLAAYVDALRWRELVTAPIVSDEKWGEWVGRLAPQGGEEKQHWALYQRRSQDATPPRARL